MSLLEQPGFRLIAPFLKPVLGLLEDDAVTEVMINPDAVYAERAGRLERMAGVRLEPLQVRRAALAITRSLGDDISDERPLLDARLPDGSRIATVLPPCSFGGPAMTIRKFGRRRLGIDEIELRPGPARRRVPVDRNRRGGRVMNPAIARPFHAELPWFGLASPRTVLTKRGQLLAGARL